MLPAEGRQVNNKNYLIILKSFWMEWLAIKRKETKYPQVGKAGRGQTSSGMFKYWHLKSPLQWNDQQSKKNVNASHLFCRYWISKDVRLETSHLRTRRSLDRFILVQSQLLKTRTQFAGTILPDTHVSSFKRSEIITLWMGDEGETINYWKKITSLLSI